MQILRDAQGSGVPLRMQMERSIVSRVSPEMVEVMFYRTSSLYVGSEVAAIAELNDSSRNAHRDEHSLGS